ncbi:S-phase kinase-associated protein 1 [Aphelenchoides avenae]|nr:S-phase kinase-associated protein 1 [Aphelenchus avenae]
MNHESAIAVADAASPAPKVVCVTTDKKRITVAVDVMRLSHKFATMYRNSGMDEKKADFPCEFPVEMEARVFRKVVDWCQEHEDQLDPVIELDVNGSRKWFHFTAFEKKFFLDCPKEELPELIEAAKSLDIRSLYVYGCQTIASIIRIVASSRKPQRFARTLLALGVERSQIEQVAQNI